MAPPRSGADEIRLMLVLSEPEEAERLRQHWARSEPDFRLLAAPGVAEALPYLAEGQADAVICDLALLEEKAARALLEPADSARRVPVVALVVPGAERAAVSLLQRGLAECVLKAGNYELLLAAAVRRVAGTHTPLWRPAVSRHAPGSGATLDLDELGMILRHEINNPLTGILGNAELILAALPNLPAEVRGRLETIVGLAVRLRDLVGNLERMVSGQARRTSVRSSSTKRRA